MRVSLPPVPESIEQLRAQLARALAGLDPKEAHEVMLAVGEAAANYVRHAERAAAGCPLVVEVAFDAVRLTVRIRDFCRPDEAQSIAPRPLDQVRPGGLGTHFIRALMDCVEYEPGSAGFLDLVLLKTLRSAPGAVCER
ncbi:MAG: ATP-binding protein [Planctomycetes bacterium]|nr:ATP-binding protein [Planctomycetota bacterium]